MSWAFIKSEERLLPSRRGCVALRLRETSEAPGQELRGGSRGSRDGGPLFSISGFENQLLKMQIVVTLDSQSLLWRIV